MLNSTNKKSLNAWTTKWL